MTWQRHCPSATDTQEAGRELAAVLRAGDVVLLEGQLGAGKTTFTQGLAKGLGVSDRVTSPTFTVVRQHECFNHPSIRTLHHADVYRTDHVDEIIELALGELVEEDALAVIEWGDMAAAVMGSDVITVVISIDDTDARTIVIDGAGSVGREDAFGRWSNS